MRKVEDIVVKYVRGRFLELEQWVDDKMTEDTRIKEMENMKRDKLIMDRIDRMEKRIDQLEKRIEEGMEMVREEVREIREMIIGVRLETEQEEGEGEGEGNVLEKEQKNED